MLQRRLFAVAGLLAGLSQIAIGQTWQTLGSVPVLTRYNDVYFVTAVTGWIVNGSGQIYRTDNGGATWQKQFERSTAHFRSIGFLDAQHGWAGNVGPGEFGATDSTVLYHTDDGGLHWTPVTAFVGHRPRGLCGMHVVNDSVMCAVGRVRGPAAFARSTDRGRTWQARDMSAHAAGLIDVYFFHPDTGLAVGLTNVTHDNSSGVILFTSDGGATWEKRFTTSRTGEWCWKISFPTRRTGYVSLQRNSLAPIYFLKTSDGGRTWQEKLFSPDYYFVQGIGFIDEQHGWIGGNSSQPTYETRDGGATWQSAGFGARVNRFRFLGDTLGYAVGRLVYKYSRQASGITTLTESPLAFALSQNYPNPFNPSTTITYRLPRAGRVSLVVYDLAGRLIERILDETQSAGEHTVVWDAHDQEGNLLRAGVYLYRIQTAAFTASKKMVLLH
ncbi:MAG: T9SS type A sorting domain-containing protein [candidate division KSB1 bacterium]|nr:T9SS type A sorting domain-containing protein [candidate division KSB1 bacterium]MDZ7275330.1 T9SS type A sorting domain-containing protein [candidate division KSB1 bacterium]MDZ7287497.1 T9SS type A sorting domain-containing protein [candidate division KSB1 bacterium]MDZ7299611.1 T9SS type A sorting domain-containing protein [candidate division KSB1 bacterium]MDZ7307404.1 T9SS type A sorting domain-containing protein [candidate division KSB1 bacterium]